MMFEGKNSVTLVISNLSKAVRYWAKSSKKTKLNDLVC